MCPSDSLEVAKMMDAVFPSLAIALCWQTQVLSYQERTKERNNTTFERRSILVLVMGTLR